MIQFTKVIAAAAAIGCAVAHPGEVHTQEQVKREIAVRDALAHKAARSLGKCAESVKMRSLQAAAIKRRAATAERLRKERGLKQKRDYFHRRDLAALQEFETVEHNRTGVVTSTDPSVLFSANTSCILTPENTIGPYFVQGELMRQDVTEGTEGVALHLELQFVDTNTCEPIPGVLIDIWSANSTGVYSGVDSAGQGGLNTTFLRGVQQTDDAGVAEFDSLFPGHYAGRATHTHVVVHTGAEILRNGSYAGGVVSHIGQLFYDEDLRADVETVEPYASNGEAVVTNNDDMWAPTQADNNYDPFPEFVYLGDSIADGLLAWISIGVDNTANHTSDATAAAYLAADGGHSTGNTVGGGAPSGDGNGTAPSGVPSGAVPSGTPPAKRDSWFSRKAMGNMRRAN